MPIYPYSLLQEKIFMKPHDDAVQRVVVIDGCNVARSSCGANRENVNCAGLMATIRFLLVRDIDVVAFLPVVYNNHFNFNVRNAEVLQKLQDLGVVTFTPARSARGDRPALVNYDDLYVLEFAERHGGSVLSGDRFEDIAFDASYAKYQRIIRCKIDVKFRALADDYVQYGRDRFYKCLPQFWTYNEDDRSLEERLRRRLYCVPNDPDFQKVVCRREKWSAERRNEIVGAIDEMLDAMAARDGTTTTVIATTESREETPVAQGANSAPNRDDGTAPNVPLATNDVTPAANNEVAAASEDVDEDGGVAAGAALSEVPSWRLPVVTLLTTMDGEELARRWLSPSVEDFRLLETESTPPLGHGEGRSSIRLAADVPLRDCSTSDQPASWYSLQKDVEAKNSGQNGSSPDSAATTRGGPSNGPTITEADSGLPSTYESVSRSATDDFGSDDRSTRRLKRVNPTAVRSTATQCLESSGQLRNAVPSSGATVFAMGESGQVASEDFGQRPTQSQPQVPSQSQTRQLGRRNGTGLRVSIDVDTKGDDIVQQLSPIFGAEVVLNVLSENVSRNLHVIADICAEQRRF